MNIIQLTKMEIQFWLLIVFQRVVTFATIENEEWVYIYPTLEEQEKGVQVVRKLKSQTARD